MIKSLSIILPVYNEQLRLKSAFNHILNFLKKKNYSKIEIIFVDDGSIDNSYNSIILFVKKLKNLKTRNKINIKVIKSKKNIGKGSALKLGVKEAKHEWILTTDIDMSVSLFQVSNWIEKKLVNKRHSAYFADRSHKKSVVERDFFRKILGDIGSFLISIILKIKIKDTQCGYKLYKRANAKFAFSKLKNYGFEHDIELVMILKSKNIEIKQLPVKWKHKDDGKVNVFLDPIKMLIGILIIRFRYL